MRSPAGLFPALLLVAASWPAVTGSPAQPAERPPDSLRARVLAEEDARTSTPTAIVTALKGPDAELRRLAVRALGRFEQPALMAAIGPTLADPDAAVRAEAANALAQSVHAGAGAEEVKQAAGLLRARLARERHPLVRGALAAALGRLPYPADADARAAAAEVLDVAFPRAARGARQPASPAVMLGALRGLHSLALGGVRSGPPRRDATGEPITWLTDEAREVVTRWLVGRAGGAAADAGSRGSGAGPGSTEDAASMLERLALQVLIGTRRPYPALGLTLLDRADPQVRATAVRWGVEALRDGASERAAVEAWASLHGVELDRATAEVAARLAALRARLEGDDAALVRFEGLRALAQIGALDRDDCAAVLRATGDPDVNLFRFVVMNLPPGCRTHAALRDRFDALSREVGETGTADGRWHRAAYALLGFAQIAPVAARPRVVHAMSAGEPWVRRYAVQAARALLVATSDAPGDSAALERRIAELAGDASPTVAAEALRALTRIRRPLAREPALRALRSSNDGEVLLEAVAALLPAEAMAGDTVRPASPDEAAASACAEALGRVTALRRETSRDPRLALLGCVATLGGAAHAGRLEGLLADFDPVVARRAAEVLTHLRAGKAAPVPRPTPLPREPLPTGADLERMEQVRVVLAIRDAGDIVLRLLPGEAPLNAWRFLRLAERGYYTGLTFHRIAPGFVVQGGSPDGHEYSGYPAFSRDEVGRQSNLRGTVGVSTRGRDTGDAQFYVNLVDNLRLDHTYTVFARVESGMDVVDALVEGAVIDRVIVR